MTNSDSGDIREEIAIIGMSGRFPSAENVETFWRNLCAGVETVSIFSQQELLESGINPTLLQQPNYVKASAILEGIEYFDAAFFGFTRREAEITDPQQRLMLECAWAGIEDAGYDLQTYEGSIGVYLGQSTNGYLANINSQPDVVKSQSSAQIRLGNDKDFLATRVSYKLNLNGPSLTVQTACSTSLVAVHLACQSLLNGECDMALAGGVSLCVPQKAGYLYQEGGINSPDGHCRAFDADAQGTFRGNGVGVVVLKRLSQALADGDCIHAVIKGSAINNDGAAKIGYTAPSVDGQAGVITETLELANVHPETVTYIETHGTATPLGDPIEIAALTQAFRTATEQKGFCAIGAVKTNIGHLDAAAGVAGLIKTVLALKHQKLPPSLNFKHPNPQIDFTNSPFYVNAQLTDWVTDRLPRRAGVSSFGIGGTNAHLVLEEAPHDESSSDAGPWQLLPLSARTEAALDAATLNLSRHLQDHPELSLADVAYTLQVGRKAHEHRRVVVCSNRDDALEALEARPAGRALNAKTETKSRPCIFMFPGQGAQHVGMGLELYQSAPTFRRVVDLCAESLKPILRSDIRQLLFPPEEQAEAASKRLQQTALAQPALFIVEYALAQLWMEWGVRPVAMLGHSIGEYVAACLAGVFSWEDGLLLVATRGRLMQQLPAGDMIAVPLSEDEARELLQARSDLSLAAINGASRCVISGPREAIDRLESELNSDGVECRRLHTSHAFHSSMMEPILSPFVDLLKNVRLRPPKIPYLSNLTGQWITAAEATAPAYWARHLRETVRFADGLGELLKKPDRILLEVGPGQTLRVLARQHPALSADQVVLPSLPHAARSTTELAFMLGTLGRLWLAGKRLDWSKLHTRQQRRRVSLPTYSFDRQRYWIEKKREARQPSRAADQTQPSAKERIMFQQLEVMSQQLELLSRKRQRVPAPVQSADAPAQSSEKSSATLVPLTPIQHLFFSQNLVNPHHWNQSLLLEVSPTIDRGFLERALNSLTIHHDSLRARFVNDSSGRRQLFFDANERCCLEHVNLGAVAENEQKAAIEAAASKTEAGLHVTDGPLVRFVLFELGAGKPMRLLVVAHHLLVDTISWGIFLEDLKTAYQQLCAGQECRLPPVKTSFMNWAERLAEYANSNKITSDAAYWLAEPRRTVKSLPRDYEDGPNTESSTGCVVALMSPAETESLLLEIPKSWHVMMSDLLLAALAQALRRWTRQDILLIDVEGHGREAIFADVDLSRTTGWFTSIYPLLLDLRDLERASEILRAVKEQVRRVPDGGIGHGLLCYLSRDEQLVSALQKLPAAQVGFNYNRVLEQRSPVGGEFKRAGETVGPERAPQNNRHHLLDFHGSVVQGQLRLALHYSRNIHKQTTVELLVQDMCATLRAMISESLSAPQRARTELTFPTMIPAI
jgi:non-ribosomal peptide synthase protein (TIGR01720 family)